MEIYITKTTTLKEKDENGKHLTQEKKFRVDADFRPTSPDEICKEFIENYCVANGEIDWMVDVCSKEYPQTIKSSGEVKMGPIQYVKYRALFIDKFFPEIKENTIKKPKLTWVEELLAKYKK